VPLVLDKLIGPRYHDFSALSSNEAHSVAYTLDSHAVRQNPRKSFLTILLMLANLGDWFKKIAPSYKSMH
jgi:hypothetical protein